MSTVGDKIALTKRMYDDLGIGSVHNLLTQLTPISIAYEGKKRLGWRANFQCTCGIIVLLNPKYVYDGVTKACRKCGYKLRGEKASKDLKRYDEKTLSVMRSYKSMLHRCGYMGNNARDLYDEITVCDRWLASFWNFLEDMGFKPELTGYELDRIRSSEDYEPGNCQWLTSNEHAKKTQNDLVELGQHNFRIAKHY